MTRSRWTHTLGALAAPALLALPFLLYRGALGLWWSEDDFFQLRYALGHAPLAYGLDPEVWRLLPNRVLSPSSSPPTTSTWRSSDLTCRVPAPSTPTSSWRSAPRRRSSMPSCASGWRRRGRRWEGSPSSSERRPPPSPRT